MQSHADLVVEAEGSKRDIATACIDVNYVIVEPHHDRIIADQPIQIVFRIQVRDVIDIIEIGLSLPFGWILLSSTSQHDTPREFYSTLSQALSANCAAYKAHKEAELWKRLSSLAYIRIMESSFDAP